MAELCGLDIWSIEVWNVDDWNLDVGLYSNVVMAGVRCVDRGRKTCKDCVKDNV